MRFTSVFMVLGLSLSGCDSNPEPGTADPAGAGGSAVPLASGAQLAACVGRAEGDVCALESAPNQRGTCEEFENGLGCVFDFGAGGMGGDGGMMGPGGMGGMMGPGGMMGQGGMMPPPEGGMGGAGGMMTPNPESVEACADLMAGAVCMFTSMRGDTIEGECVERDGERFCRPDMPPPQGGMGGMPPPEGGMGGMGGMPPPEGGMGGMGGGMRMRPREAACVDRMAGDACSFENRDGEQIDGVCALDADDVLVCRPDMLPPEGGMGGMGGMPPPEGGMGGEGGMMPPPEGGMGGEGGMMPPPEGGMGGEGGMMPPPEGGMGGMMGPPPEAQAACDGLDADAPCAFVAPNGRNVEGTCRQTPDGDFACVP